MIPLNNSTPIPAATLILFREDGNGAAQHLMIERAASMVFAAGALVFPGGRIDPDDHDVAASIVVHNVPDDPDDAAARVAAIRETLEETGQCVAIQPRPDIARVQEWRALLKTGHLFSTLLAQSGATLDLGLLVPFARWCPNLGDKRRFDTRFYIARARSRHAVEVDAGEVTHYHWLTAQDAIDAEAAGRHRIIFPTMRNIERLATCPGFDIAVAHATSTIARTIVPEIQTLEGEQWLCIPEDAGYPVVRALLESVFGPELSRPGD